MTWLLLSILFVAAPIPIIALEPAKGAPEVVECLWEPVGPGGGGGMFDPGFSPSDNGRVMTMTCDMGGIYRSLDHGRSWEMMDFGMAGRPGGPLGFDPTNPKVLYAVKQGAIWKSLDTGTTWRQKSRIPSVYNDDIVVDPNNPLRVWIALTKGAQTPIMASEDGGTTWKKSSLGIADGVEVRGLHLDLASPVKLRRLFAATGSGLYLSHDNGVSWAKSGTAPDGEYVDMTGLSRAGGAPILYVAVKDKGVFRSETGGVRWEPAGNDLPQGGAVTRKLAMSNADPRILYAVGDNNKVFRTSDGGRSWRLVHDTHKDTVADDWVDRALGVGWSGRILGLAVNPADANELVFTDMMRSCRSRDGGKSWQALYSRKEGGGWSTTGLGVTTCYKISFDPKDHVRQYTTYTDVGLFKSSDNGRSWRPAVTGVPRNNFWFNTCYEIAIDPEAPSRIWGAFSRLHDLPFAGGADHGGICVSNDAAESWTPCKGLPEAPGTAIVLDPNSPVSHRTLYAGLYREGIYKSIDGGRTWAIKSRGLPDKPAVWRVALHRDGTLICAVTRFQGKLPGGLYVSRDGAETWRQLENGNAFKFLLDVAMDQRSSRTIYAAGFSDPNGAVGGLYKSLDGGDSWRQLLNDRQIRGVTLDPGNPNVVYACCCATGGGPTRGILRSADGGATWKRLGGLPFYNLNQVTVDPRNPRTVYVATFGGDVWKTTLPSGI